MPLIRKKNLLLAFVALVLLNLVFGIVVLSSGGHRKTDPRLLGERLGIEHLGEVHHLFYAPYSHADLQAARPDLIACA